MTEIYAKETKSLQFIAITLILQFSLLLVTFFDIPFARQIIGFFYLTFIPGFVALKLLKLENLGVIEKLLFVVGLSISLLMLLGLAINEVGPVIGIQKPLEFTSLILPISSFVLFGVFVSYFKNMEKQHLGAITLKDLLKSSLLVASTLLGVLGGLWVDIYGNNLLLLFMLLFVAILFSVSVLSKNLFPSKYHSIILFTIALGLLFHALLFSRYIVPHGSDVPSEYFVFKNTNYDAHWGQSIQLLESAFGRYYSMLSITILPTFYIQILNMDSTLLFKTIYPLIFALVPLGVYIVWQRYIGKKYAFIATFFFIAQQTFYTEMLGLNRQIVAELFFVLLLLVILNNKLMAVSKIALFTIFSFGLVTSHYGLSLIFLFFLVATYFYLYLTKRSTSRFKTFSVLIFSVMLFFWYIFTCNSAVFLSITDIFNYVLMQFSDFFNPASRGQMVLVGLGLESPPTVLNAIGRLFAYATQFLIVVGFIGLITKRVNFHFDEDYLSFTTLAMALLGALIVVPGLANTLNMTRFYHILLFFLAPLCALGADFLVSLVSKRKKLLVSILLLVILVPYFLFQTGFMYEVTKSQSWSVPLSGYRMGSRLITDYGVVTEQEVLGAQWLSSHSDSSRLKVHVDPYERTPLEMYGLISRSNMSWLSNLTQVEADASAYLGKLNTVYGKVLGIDAWNTTSIGDLVLHDLSKVYSNGDCEIYKNTANQK
ncbi:MAG: DUF2206 domain-containing protein [Candidatus Jordarchaeaceae archaeon]